MLSFTTEKKALEITIDGEVVKIPTGLTYAQLKSSGITNIEEIQNVDFLCALQKIFSKYSPKIAELDFQQFAMVVNEWNELNTAQGEAKLGE